MTESSDTAIVPGSIIVGSGITPSFKVERGLPGQVKNLSTPSGRLTSLRTRDLTLSGTLKKSKVGTEALLAPCSQTQVLHFFFFLFVEKIE